MLRPILNVMENGTFTVTISYAGKKHPVQCSGPETLQSLGQRVAELTQTSFATLKFLVKKAILKPCESPEMTLQQAGQGILHALSLSLRNKALFAVESGSSTSLDYQLCRDITNRFA
jgi:hypothetical protein